jgi:hypothetical protein
MGEHAIPVQILVNVPIDVFPTAVMNGMIQEATKTANKLFFGFLEAPVS